MEREGRENKDEISVNWWNGGGALVSRITTNPELGKFLSSGPDIFVYGEALVKRHTKEIVIPGYKTTIHKAQKNGLRRGLVVYYQSMYANVITKDLSSKRFDILWLRFQSKTFECMLGFFYAPGANHSEKIREDFYDELRKGIDKYNDKQIYLMGDSNARLGEFSSDRSINGKITSNNNKALFLGLLEYTRMTYLNRVHELGKPTYEI